MSWGATQAKAKFSELLDRAESEGPQVVRRRKREFYILTKEQMDKERGAGAEAEVQPFVSGWDALRPSSGEFFDDVEFPRLSSPVRVVDL